MTDNGARANATCVAYFSMEIALDSAIPTYSGGLGVLAGDMLRSAADRALPLIGVSLVHRKGYFRQALDADGNQTEFDEPWDPAARGLEPLDLAASVTVEGRRVALRAWRFVVVGLDGGTVAVYLLDTDLEANDPQDRALTDALYGGDERYRLAQEIVLGIGGALLLREIGIDELTRCYHLNEGHSALLVLALLEAAAAAAGKAFPDEDELETVRRRCVFTTHTPVPAGHDSFDLGLSAAVLGAERTALLERVGALHDGRLNMTALALHGSRYVNGVALRHTTLLRELLPQIAVRAITNGVHATTWTAPSFAELYDRRLPEWRRDTVTLRHAVGIPRDEIAEAHRAAKAALLDEVGRRTGRGLDPAVFTIGFARRATGYKRADLIFTDLERLRAIAHAVGRFQLIFAGKAHPRDEHGKALIRAVVAAARALGDDVPVVYLENYEMGLARILCSGVDLWLNTPAPPQEASGTSGMKAALNGVPSLSVVDGWWYEGHVDGVTGWAIGSHGAEAHGDNSNDAASLYALLEGTVLPAFYNDPQRYAAIMRSAIALNGSYFNTQRMVWQYALDAYRFDSGALLEAPAALR